VAGNRAIVRALSGPAGEAEHEARRGIALWPGNAYAHYALGIVEYRRGHLDEAAMHTDSVLRFTPDHSGAKVLAEAILEASRRAADSLGAPRR